MNNTPDISHLPRLPTPIAFPLGLIPTGTHSQVMSKVLNRIFAPELEDGELDFLQGRAMLITVTDARLSYRITLQEGKLTAANSNQPDDLSIEGTAYDFLLLATRKEDADTLFFNRRLRLGGDTELGLYVKNFLDALELDDRMGPLLKLLDGATSLFGRIPRLPSFPGLGLGRK